MRDYPSQRRDPLQVAIATEIARADGWLSSTQAKEGRDPLDVDYGSDPLEIHLTLIGLSWTGGNVSDAFDQLKLILERMAKLPAQKLSVQLFSEEVLRGISGPVLPLLITARPKGTSLLLRTAFSSLREQVGLPSDEEVAPYVTFKIGASSPSEARWCMWNLYTIARLREVELKEQEMFYLVRFMQGLAEERMLIANLTNELYGASTLLQGSAVTDWSQWRGHTGRDPPSFSKSLTPRQIARLGQLPLEHQEEYSQKVFRRIYAYRLAQLRQSMAQVKAAKNRDELTQFLIGEIVKAIIVSRVVSSNLLLGGDANPGESVQVFDYQDPPDPPPVIDEVESEIEVEVLPDDQTEENNPT